VLSVLRECYGLARGGNAMLTIDLSQTITGGMPVYPGDEPVSLTLTKTLDRDHYNAYTLKTGLHAGTHVDMPMHLLPGSRTADDYAIELFAGRGVLLDVRGETKIGYKELYNQIVSAGDIVLLFTGFSEYYNDEQTYFGSHPVVDEGLARFLASRRIKMLGMDMPSPDMPPFPVHKLLLSGGIFILENITNLINLIKYDKFDVEAVPLKLQAEASPVRAFARV
jgi:kynurenine formamidase